MNVLKEKLFISVDQRKSAAEIGKRTDEFSIVLFSHRAVFIAVVVFGSRAVFSGAGHMANLRHQVMMPSCLAELKGEAVISNSPGRTGTVSGHGEHIAELVSVQGGDIPGAGFGTKKGPPLCAPSCPLWSSCGFLRFRGRCLPQIVLLGFAMPSRIWNSSSQRFKLTVIRKFSFACSRPFLPSCAANSGCVSRYRIW